MSKSKAQTPTELAFVPALILHGLDDAKKPHAAVFAEAEVALAMKSGELDALRRPAGGHRRMPSTRP